MSFHKNLRPPIRARPHGKGITRGLPVARDEQTGIRFGRRRHFQWHPHVACVQHCAQSGLESSDKRLAHRREPFKITILAFREAPEDQIRHHFRTMVICGSCARRRLPFTTLHIYCNPLECRQRILTSKLCIICIAQT